MMALGASPLPLSLNSDARKTTLVKKQKTALQIRFDEAGATFTHRADGNVAVTNSPKLRVSSPTFLSDEMVDFEAAAFGNLGYNPQARR